MLTIVIPTLNAAAHLPRLLSQIGGEAVVVSDGGSSDNTLVIAMGHGARIAAGCSGRGWQLARGAKWAASVGNGAGDNGEDWLLFLHADGRLGDGWRAAVDRHIAGSPDKAAYFKFRADDKGWRPRLMERIVALRCWAWQMPYGDQGLLISAKLYGEIGGYPDWDLFEDVKISQNLRGRLKRLDAAIYTDATKYKTQGYLARSRANFALYRRFIKGARPEDLAVSYRKRAKS